MTCDACATAERNPLSGYRRGDCRECDTRSLAHAQEFAYRRDGDEWTPEYRAAIVPRYRKTKRQPLSVLALLNGGSE